jgi:membrane protein implicated in regulation of membrane protease activity
VPGVFLLLTGVFVLAAGLVRLRPFFFASSSPKVFAFLVVLLVMLLPLFVFELKNKASDLSSK